MGIDSKYLDFLFPQAGLAGRALKTPQANAVSAVRGLVQSPASSSLAPDQGSSLLLRAQQAAQADLASLKPPTFTTPKKRRTLLTGFERNF